jgi:hypothetical protein
LNKIVNTYTQDYLVSTSVVQGWAKKPKNWLKRENRKKNNWKNRTKKKPFKPIKILKKPTSSVRFWFYKQKTKSNRNRKKPSQTGKPSQTEKLSQNHKKPRKPSQNQKNWAKPVQTEPKKITYEEESRGRFDSVSVRTETGRFDSVSVRTETGRFDPVSVFFLNFFLFGYFFW